MNNIDYSDIFKIYSKWDVPEDVILHMLRVAELVRKLSLRLKNSIKLGISESDINELITAALVHDVGKALVDKKILNKPGSLTNSEFDEMKRHVEYTVQILLEEGVKEKIVGYVARHHERNSGKGYPCGMKELSILDEIIAVCDIYDAVSSNRPYRKKLSFDQAKAILLDTKNGFDIFLLKEFFKEIKNCEEAYLEKSNVS